MSRSVLLLLLLLWLLSRIDRMTNRKKSASRAIDISHQEPPSLSIAGGAGSPSDDDGGGSKYSASPPTSIGRKRGKKAAAAAAAAKQAAAVAREIERELASFVPNGTNWFFHCECGVYGADYNDGRSMIRCDVCHVWVHTQCVGLVRKSQLSHKAVYVCVHCRSGVFRANAAWWAVPSAEELAAEKAKASATTSSAADGDLAQAAPTTAPSQPECSDTNQEDDAMVPSHDSQNAPDPSMSSQVDSGDSSSNSAEVEVEVEVESPSSTSTDNDIGTPQDLVVGETTVQPVPSLNETNIESAEQATAAPVDSQPIEPASPHQPGSCLDASAASPTPPSAGTVSLLTMALRSAPQQSTSPTEPTAEHLSPELGSPSAIDEDEDAAEAAQAAMLAELVISPPMRKQQQPLSKKQQRRQNKAAAARARAAQQRGGAGANSSSRRGRRAADQQADEDTKAEDENANADSENETPDEAPASPVVVKPALRQQGAPPRCSSQRVVFSERSDVFAIPTRFSWEFAEEQEEAELLSSGRSPRGGGHSPTRGRRGGNKRRR